MDLTIQMRSIELLTKFLKHDLRNVPSYGYSVQKNRFALSSRSSKALPRSIPENEGVHSRDVERLYKLFSDEYYDIAPHGLILLRHGRVISEGYWSPYSKETPNMLFSMSKTVTATAVGIACDEGIMSIDEKLIDIFPDMSTLTAISLPKFLREHKVKHLLTMSTGVRFNEVGSMLDENWIKMFMQSLPKFDAGAAFEYNSLNSYMLAAIIWQKTGQTLTEYLRPRLYEPLGIDSFDWETCPQGIEKGGWGLSLKLEDAAKIGQLYLDKGVYGGQRILSEAWVEKATQKQIETPNGESHDGYGFQIWMDKELPNSFSFRGVYGQYVMVFPSLNIVAAMYSGSPYMMAQTNIQKHMGDCLRYVQNKPLPVNDVAYEQLNTTISALRVRIEPRTLIFDDTLGHDRNEMLKIAETMDGREYRFDNNNGGLFPMSIQSVHGNYTMGIDLIRFEKTDSGMNIVFYEYAERNTIFVNAAEEYSHCEIASRGEYQCVDTRAEWKIMPESILIRLILHFTETPFARIVHIKIQHNDVTVAFDESPTVEESVQQLFTLIGISRTAFMKSILSQGKRENIENVLRRSTAPKAAGVLISNNN